MGITREKRVFEDVYETIKKKKRMTEEECKKLFCVFNDRFDNALKTMKEERVRKYVFHPSKRVVWSVIGKEQEYQILPLANFCMCNDFYFRVVDQQTFLCYHLIAQKLAETLNKYVRIDKGDQEYEALMVELRDPPRADRKLFQHEVENIRRIVKAFLLKEIKASSKQLLSKIQAYGFEVQTSRHLARILVTDKKKRFKSEKGVWMLAVET